MSASKRPPEGQERRSTPRFEVTWAVDCSNGETFLFASITNISEMGIFIATRSPPPIGSQVSLRFTPPGEETFDLRGVVTWINPYREAGPNLNPGFGVRFSELVPEMRERIVDLVRTIAYLPDAG